MCVCVGKGCIHISIYCALAEPREGHQVSSYITVHLAPLRQDLSPTLQCFLLGWADSQQPQVFLSQIPIALGFQVLMRPCDLFCGCWDLNAGLHGCTASTPNTEPSLQPSFLVICVLVLRLPHYVALARSQRST